MEISYHIGGYIQGRVISIPGSNAHTLVVGVSNYGASLRCCCCCCGLSSATWNRMSRWCGRRVLCCLLAPCCSYQVADRRYYRCCLSRLHGLLPVFLLPLFFTTFERVVLSCSWDPWEPQDHLLLTAVVVDRHVHTLTIGVQSWSLSALLLPLCFFVGELEADVVLMRLLFCVLLPCLLLLNAADVRWVSAASRIKLH